MTTVQSRETPLNASSFYEMMSIEEWLTKILELKVFYGRDVLLTFDNGSPVIVGRFSEEVPEAPEVPAEVEAPVVEADAEALP